MSHLLQRTKLVAAILLIAVITLCATLLTGKLFGRARVADLTQDKLYSLSSGTLSILSKINQPVTLKLYYSRQSAQEGPEGIRFWNNYFLYVRDVLEEYVLRSDGMLQLEVLDPTTYSEEEEQAVGYGLKRFDLQDNSFIFGLVAVTDLGKETTIPFFQPQRQIFVEYDVSKLISDLTRRQKLSVGVISSLPVLGDNYPPYMMMMLQQQGKAPKAAWGVFQSLRESYDVFEVKIKDGVFQRRPDYLLVIHPKDLDRPTLFAIDQYIVNGGKAAVFVDPFCMADQPQQQQMYQQPDPAQSASDLNALLTKWGLSTKKGDIVVDPELAVKVPLQQGRPAEPFPPFINLTKKDLDSRQVIVAGLNGLQMLFAGNLNQTTVEGMQAQALAFTSGEGNLWNPNPMQLSRPPSFAQMMYELKSENRGRKSLAILLTGKFKSNFPDGIEFIPQPEEKQSQNPMMDPMMMMNGMGTSGDGDMAEAPSAPAAVPAEAAGQQAAPQPVKLPAIKEGSEPGMLVVTADVDMLTDQIAFRGNQFGGMMESGDNASYLLNVVDFLGGSYDLLAVRTRGEYLRPFTLIDDIEREAEKAGAGKIEELNASIAAMQKQLADLLRSQDGKNTELLQKGILEKKRELEGQVIRANRELRKLQQEKRQAVAGLQNRLEWLNLLLAPSVILLIAIGLWLHRRKPAAH